MNVFHKTGGFVARFSYSPYDGVLVGRSTLGHWYVLLAVTERSPEALKAPFWADNVATAKVTPEFLKSVKWAYTYRLLSGFVMGDREIAFGDAGAFKTGGTKFWHRWEVQSGQLVLFTKTGVVGCRFNYDAKLRRLVGWGRDGDVLQLVAK